MYNATIIVTEIDFTKQTILLRFIYSVFLKEKTKKLHNTKHIIWHVHQVETYNTSLWKNSGDKINRLLCKLLFSGRWLVVRMGHCCLQWVGLLPQPQSLLPNVWPTILTDIERVWHSPISVALFEHQVMLAPWLYCQTTSLKPFPSNKPPFFTATTLPFPISYNFYNSMLWLNCQCSIKIQNFTKYEWYILNSNHTGIPWKIDYLIFERCFL